MDKVMEKPKGKTAEQHKLDKQVLERFEEDLIPVGKIVVHWPDAQQPFVRGHADSIKKVFDWELLGTVLVCPVPGGTFHPIDGQHRVEVVKELFGPKETIPCRVFRGMDKQKAAHLFHEFNLRRRKPSQLDLFRTAVTAGQEPEASIAKSVAACGYRVGTSGLKGVKALEAAFKVGGAKLLEEALWMIRKAWGLEGTRAIDAIIIRAISSFLAAYQEADRSRLVNVLQKAYTPARLVGRIKASSEMQAISSTHAGVQLISVAYNSGLREGARLGKT